jgi:23S rRNA pseudouridine2605 synthase
MHHGKVEGNVHGPGGPGNEKEEATGGGDADGAAASGAGNKLKKGPKFVHKEDDFPTMAGPGAGADGGGGSVVGGGGRGGSGRGGGGGAAWGAGAGARPWSRVGQ